MAAGTETRSQCFVFRCEKDSIVCFESPPSAWEIQPTVDLESCVAGPGDAKGSPSCGWRSRKARSSSSAVTASRRCDSSSSNSSREQAWCRFDRHRFPLRTDSDDLPFAHAFFVFVFFLLQLLILRMRQPGHFRALSAEESGALVKSVSAVTAAFASAGRPTHVVVAEKNHSTAV